MGFWGLIMGALVLVVIAGLIYLATRFMKFSFVRRLCRGRKPLMFLVGLGIVAAVTAISYFTMGYMNAAIVVVHFMLFFALCELGFFIARRIRRRAFLRYWAGLAAIVLTVCYLGVGMIQAYGVWEKDYSLTTDKTLGTLRVAMIADSHTGTTFDGEGFARHMEELQKTEPDLVIVAGDFVDDDTTRENMMRCCEALGDLQTRYGVFFSYGNHDRGYFNYRNFSGDELIQNLTANGVHVLCDETELVDGRFYIIGRKDKSMPGRAGMAELIEGLDASKYMIVIDHQPADYAAQAETGVDLVLSGHTHGGQLLILNWIMELMHQNDMLYGIRETGDTTFIVTSGISDWAIKFKTGCRSEFVVVDIEGR